jgi:hypothetical protein
MIVNSGEDKPYDIGLRDQRVGVAVPTRGFGHLPELLPDAGIVRVSSYTIVRVRRLQFVIAAGDLLGGHRQRGQRGRRPAVIASRSSVAIEYPASSASARSSATFASAPFPDCQATNSNGAAGAGTRRVRRSGRRFGDPGRPGPGGTANPLRDLVTPRWPQYNIPADRMAPLVDGAGWRMDMYVKDGGGHAVLSRGCEIAAIRRHLGLPIRPAASRPGQAPSRDLRQHARKRGRRRPAASRPARLPRSHHVDTQGLRPAHPAPPDRVPRKASHSPPPTSGLSPTSSTASSRSRSKPKAWPSTRSSPTQTSTTTRWKQSPCRR